MEKIKEIFESTFKKSGLNQGYVYYGASARFVVGMTHKQDKYSAVYMEDFLVGELSASGIFFVKKTLVLVQEKKLVNRCGDMAIHKRDNYIALYDSNNKLYYIRPGYTTIPVENWLKTLSFKEKRHSMYRDVHTLLKLHKQL